MQCARLFVPEIRDPTTRAQTLVDWLCDQSFHFIYEDPTTGAPQTQSRGIPQGPDLSAYLANISLFPLDRVLTEIVAGLDEKFKEKPDSPQRGGVYARYVDDMVIIAPTAHDLARMRTAVEQELGRLGLELSPKTNPIPVMNEGELRKWLTDRRGAGLGVSGPFAGPPVNEPLAALEPLAGAGQIDRGESLLILHDPRLDDPDTTVAEIETAILAAKRAAELRHGDQALAARHLWRCVLESVNEQELKPASVVTAFEKLWLEVEEPVINASGTAAQGVDEMRKLLAWLDGIERFLTSRQDRNPRLSESKHQRILNQREKMAGLVHHGLCEHVVRHCITEENDQDHRHMFELRTLAIRRAACIVAELPLDADIPGKAGNSFAKARLLISIAEVTGRSELLDRSRLRVVGLPAEILLHEAIARLRIANRAPMPGPITSVPAEIDPLMPMANGVKEFARLPTLVAHQILALWMPDTSTNVADGRCAQAALSALVNLASRHAVDLLAKRPTLARFALHGTAGTGKKTCLLPAPPGAGVPGLIGLQDDDRFILRAAFHPASQPGFCPGLEWNYQDSDDGWVRSEAPLHPYAYLAASAAIPANDHITRWLALAFRSLARLGNANPNAESCAPTAVNLLGPGLDNFAPDSKWEVLGFALNNPRIRGQAFVRHGDGGLLPEAIPDQLDHLWRIGVALADWLGRIHCSRSLSSVSLSAPAFIPQPELDWAQEALLRVSLYRLRGRSLRLSRPLRMSTTTGLPLTIERVLRRLETFPLDSTADSRLAHLVATLGAGRALEARLGTKIDPCMPGGTIALLADLARPQFRSDEELALRLPGNDEPMPGWFLTPSMRRREGRALRRSCIL